MRKAFILALILPALAQADTVQMTWEAVTTRVDGSPTTGFMTYEVTKNGEDVIVTGDTQHTLDASINDTLCVAALEDGLNGAPSCTVLPVYPAQPEINIQIIFQVN